MGEEMNGGRKRGEEEREKAKIEKKRERERERDGSEAENKMDSTYTLLKFNGKVPTPVSTDSTVSEFYSTLFHKRCESFL